MATKDPTKADDVPVAVAPPTIQIPAHLLAHLCQAVTLAIQSGTFCKHTIAEQHGLTGTLLQSLKLLDN